MPKFLPPSTLTLARSTDNTRRRDIQPLTSSVCGRDIFSQKTLGISRRFFFHFGVCQKYMAVDELLHEVVKRPAPQPELRVKGQKKWEGLVTRFTLDDLFDRNRTPLWSAKSKFVLIKGWDHKGNHRQNFPRKVQKRTSSVTRIASRKDTNDTPGASDSPRSPSATQDLERRLWGSNISAISFSSSQRRPASAHCRTRQRSEIAGDTSRLQRSASHDIVSGRSKHSSSSKLGPSVSSCTGRYSSLRMVVPPGRTEDSARRSSLPEGAFAPARSPSISQAAQDTRKAYLATMLANESPPGALLPMIEAEMGIRKRKKKSSSPLRTADEPPASLTASRPGSASPPTAMRSPIALIESIKANASFGWDE